MHGVDGERQISLSAPILDTTLPELIENETQVTEIRDILSYWLDLDRTNLMRIRTGTLNFAMPQSYETNSVKWADRTATRTFGKKHVDITDSEIRSSFSGLHPSLVWLMRVLMATGDPVGAALIAMLLRHRDPKEFDIFDTAIRMNRLAGVAEPPGSVSTSFDHLYQLVDELIAEIGARLNASRTSP